MGLRSWLRGLVEGRTFTLDYSRRSDAELTELWSQRNALTPDARTQLQAELDRRGIALDVAPIADEPEHADQNPENDADDAVDDPPRREPAPELDGLTKLWPSKRKLQSAMTTRDLRVQGVPCKADTMITFHRNGRVQSATLAIDWACDGEALAAGMLVGFHPDGRLQTWYAVNQLDEPRTIAGHVLPAGTRVSVVDGKLETLVLAKPATFAGHELPAGAHLSFHDGVLVSITHGEPLVVGGIPCAAHEMIRLYPDGRVEEAWLAEDFEIDGVPCQRGEIVRFFESGALARAYVARDLVLDGIPCREGTRIYLDEQGRLFEAIASRDIVVDGVPCPAGREISLEAGRLVSVRTAVDFELGGIPCRAGLVLLGDKGLRRVKLSREHAFGALALPAGTEITLDDDQRLRLARHEAGLSLFGRHATLFEIAADGSLLRTLPVSEHDVTIHRETFRIALCVLAEDVEVDGMPCKATSALAQFPDGTIESFVPSRAVTVAGLPCHANTDVRRYANGKLACVTLAKDTAVGGVPCKRATGEPTLINGVASYPEHVRFHDNGQLAWTILAERHRIGELVLEKGETAAFHPDGAPSVGTLAEDGRYEDKLLKRRTLFACHPGNAFRQGTLAAPWRDLPADTFVECAPDGSIVRAGPARWPLVIEPL